MANQQYVITHTESDEELLEATRADEEPLGGDALIEFSDRGATGLNDHRTLEYLEGKAPKKWIIVPNKIINIVF